MDTVRSARERPLSSMDTRNSSTGMAALVLPQIFD
jgi:hypothetical protein